MRVLMVSSLWPPAALGGAETYAAALADALEGAGHQVGVVTMGGPDGRIVGQVPSWPYSLEEWSRQGAGSRLLFHGRDQMDPVAALVLDRAVREFRPDVVHSHAVVGMSASVLLVPRRRKIAHVHTLHDYWLLCQRSTLVTRAGDVCRSRCLSCRAVSAVRLGVLGHRPADVVLAVSDAVATPHRVAGVENVRVVYNPLPRRRRRRRRPPGPTPTFGFLGQLVGVKGIDTLLTAFRSGPAGGRLLVGGSGPSAAAVAATDGVEYRGWLDDDGKARFFDDIDCLVVPSEWSDPAPLVVGEAVAAGVPVLGSDAGGIPELVPPPCRELLFTAGDPDALARAMARFAEDPLRYADTSVATPGWPEHLASVLGAYADAAAGRDRR